MDASEVLTVLTPSMSRPLAATSVATRISICSSLNRLQNTQKKFSQECSNVVLYQDTGFLKYIKKNTKFKPVIHEGYKAHEVKQVSAVPETLQSLGLGEVAVELAHLQANEAQQDVHAVGLLLGLRE